jgi:hypothetical protein
MSSTNEWTIKEIKKIKRKIFRTKNNLALIKNVK